LSNSIIQESNSQIVTSQVNGSKSSFSSGAILLNPPSVQVTSFKNLSKTHVGNGKPKDKFCGTTGVYSCPTPHFHNRTLNPEHHGKSSHFLYPKSCNRPECSICFKSWAFREAKRSTYRLQKFAHLKRKYARQIIVSPPKNLYGRSLQSLIATAYSVLARRSIKAGMLVYHNTRRKCNVCGGNIATNKKLLFRL